MTFGDVLETFTELLAGRLLPGALYTLCLDKDGTGSASVFEAYGDLESMRIDKGDQWHAHDVGLQCCLQEIGRNGEIMLKSMIGR